MVVLEREFCELRDGSDSSDTKLIDIEHKVLGPEEQ